MRFSVRYSMAITILLVSIVGKGLGELIVVRHPPTDGGDRVKATCITEELDAAFVWNYDNTTGNVEITNNITSPHPEGAASSTTYGCEIGTSHLASCFLEWKGDLWDWKGVKSMANPMGSVHDYRWEGFNELTVTNQTLHDAGIRQSKVVIFSARGSRVMKIGVCDRHAADGLCIWIIIRSESDGGSRILTCKEKVPNNSTTEGKHCKDNTYGKPDRKTRLKPFEWRTFRIEWGVEGDFVRVFEDVDKVPFLEGTVSTKALSNRYLKTTGDPGTRVRYHDYRYIQAKTQNSSIFTEAFRSGREELCFELTVGLCSKCGVAVSLVDASKSKISDTEIISGTGTSTTNGLPTWQSRTVKLSIKTPRPNNLLSLEIKNIRYYRKKGKGFWAIDKVRSCQPRGTMRASTITVPRPKTATNKYRPRIVCQKLSSRGSDTIDLSADYTLDPNTSRSGRMLEVWRESCGSSCGGFGKGSLICNSHACGCDRGYQGENCTGSDSLSMQPPVVEIPSKNVRRDNNTFTECTLGSYGSNCSEKCGPCKGGKCNKETGRCEEGCESVEFESPFCQRVEPPLDWQNLSWLIVLPILGMILLPLYIWYRKRTKAPAMSRQPSYLEIIPSTPAVSRGNSPPDHVGQINLALGNVYSVPNDPDSWRVPVENFEEYVKNAVTSAQLSSQFKLLPRGSTKPSNYGRLPENMQKNRSTTVIAYDDSRVILRKIPGDPYSDYINANYIRGFGKERAYIATQGPMSNTVADFWRMVWQEDVRIVCMLTNVVEDCENKCVQYWPDIGTEVRYGDIVISNVEHQVFADFTFRSLELRYQQQSREVSHLHYTGWPSHGIPTYPQSLALYLKKLLKLPTGGGPVVVHCNTGDDRTGTIILCDICLREVTQTKAIDVTGVTTRLRESRANMVGTLQQFLLAHILITEVLMARPTQVPCDDILPKRMRQLRNRLPYDMERLNETMWQQQTLESLAEPMASGIADDADNEPSREGTPEVVYANLQSTFESRISRIGAVSVDGVEMKRQHLASRLPPSFKLYDFWRFVTENDVKLIILLQCSDPGNPSCTDIMPDESVVLQMPDIEFRTGTNSQNSDEEECFKSEKVTLVKTSEENAEPQRVTVLTCRGWARGSNGKPPEPVALVSLWTASERVLREEAQTLVLCHDGITGCGLYLAMSFLLERMAVERECDVISAIRAVRRSRPDFVQSVEQCEYLYDAAEKYAEYFECYANFT